MRRWKGRWVMAVALVHTAFALVVFGSDLAALVRDGVIDTVGADARRGAVVWFLLFGPALWLAGQGIDALEARRQPLPRAMGITLLLLASLGAALMPASGFWLALPPALALLWPARVTAPT